jgi:hypothetical protein
MKHPQDAFELIDGTDVLRAAARHVRPCSDDLVLQVFHRTTGGARSVLVRRPDAERLHAWLGRWLAEGWDGVKRECGAEHAEDGYRWRCGLPPGDHRTHRGRAVLWPSGSPCSEQAWVEPPKDVA